VARTFSAADEEQLRQLHADDVCRNEIARQTGWSVGTVTVTEHDRCRICRTSVV